MIVLPWPPKELSPNARVHRMVKAKRTKAYREACYWITKEAVGKLANYEPDSKSKWHLSILFVPPNRQRRDLDNMFASIKGGLDGLADALGIDDSWFRPVTIDVADYVGGMVKISLYPARCGEEVSRLAHNQEIDGANPSTATKHMGIA